MSDPREQLAEALSIADGEMTEYKPTACDDHNHWSWRGNGHGDTMRNHYYAMADAVLEVLSRSAHNPDH